MLVLVFYIDSKAYCTKADAIECIIPNISLQLLDATGILRMVYKAQPVDIVDLSYTYTQRPSARALSTRISIVKGFEGSQRPYWGFRAEHMRRLYTVEGDTLSGRIHLDNLACEYLPLATIYKALNTPRSPDLILQEAPSALCLT